MNFINETNKKINKQELTLEGIEEEIYRYLIENTFTQYLKDYIRLYNDINFDENSECFLDIILKHDKNNNFELYISNGTIETKHINYNLTQNETWYFLNYISRILQIYKIRHLVGHRNIEFYIETKCKLKDLLNMYYQELQNFEYEEEKRKIK